MATFWVSRNWFVQGLAEGQLDCWRELEEASSQFPSTVPLTLRQTLKNHQGPDEWEPSRLRDGLILIWKTINSCHILKLVSVIVFGVTHLRLCLTHHETSFYIQLTRKLSRSTVTQPKLNHVASGSGLLVCIFVCLLTRTYILDADASALIDFSHGQSFGFLAWHFIPVQNGSHLPTLSYFTDWTKRCMESLRISALMFAYFKPKSCYSLGALYRLVDYVTKFIMCMIKSLLGFFFLRQTDEREAFD